MARTKHLSWLAGQAAFVPNSATNSPIYKACLPMVVAVVCCSAIASHEHACMTGATMSRSNSKHTGSTDRALVMLEFTYVHTTMADLAAEMLHAVGIPPHLLSAQDGFRVT